MKKKPVGPTKVASVPAQDLKSQLAAQEALAREACLTEVNKVLEKYGMVIIPEVRIVGTQITSVCHIGKAG